MTQEAGEGDEVQSDHGLRQPLVVTRQTAKANRPGKAALYDPPKRGDSTKPRAASECSTTSSRMPRASASGCAPVSSRSTYMPTPPRSDRSPLASLRQAHLYPGAILLGGRRDVQGERVSERIYSAMRTLELHLRLAHPS